MAAAQAYGCGTADNLQALAVIKALDAIGAFGMSTLTENKRSMPPMKRTTREGDEISKMEAALIASSLRFREEDDTSLLPNPEKTNQSHYADS